MNVRPYAPSDWERLCAIHDAARLRELQASGLAAAFLRLEQTAENEGLFDGDVVVAEIEGEVCGFAAYCKGELTWLYVDPARYRKGIGRLLLRHAIEASSGNMNTEVLVGNEPALALYLSEGFTVQRRVDGKLAGNEAFAASGYLLQRTATEGLGPSSQDTSVRR
jgi:ribosomal protein S18 acetylase RimI-like enzyme